VGLYKLSIQLTHSFESAWFQPLNLESENLVSKFAFQIQLAPLHRGALASSSLHTSAGDLGRLCTHLLRMCAAVEDFAGGAGVDVDVAVDGNANDNGSGNDNGNGSGSSIGSGNNNGNGSGRRGPAEGGGGAGAGRRLRDDVYAKAGVAAGAPLAAPGDAAVMARLLAPGPPLVPGGAVAWCALGGLERGKGGLERRLWWWGQTEYCRAWAHLSLGAEGAEGCLEESNPRYAAVVLTASSRGARVVGAVQVQFS
jgi:hypothetical protein